MMCHRAVPPGAHQLGRAVFIAILALSACGGEIRVDDANSSAGDGSVIEPDGGGSDDRGDLANIDQQPASDSSLPRDSAPPSDTSSGVEINSGWLGGACSSPADCHDPNINDAICETSGFPNGFCTQVCSGNICPDTDYAATGATTSRCIDADGKPRCVSECDFDRSSTGCRPGYVCVERARYESSSVFSVCLPGPDGLWPGETTPPGQVGSGCVAASQCPTTGECLELQGGYCSRTNCDAVPCPSGSVCGSVMVKGYLPARACFKSCATSSDCRQAEGYSCASDKTCRPAPRPSWNKSVGAADCQSAWGSAGSALSACDAVKDSYLVIRKSARNLALCEAGALVASYQIGLGFSPLGDKQVAGDGKTPEGVFYVARRNPASKFHKAFVLSYPDKADAVWGVAEGVITASERAVIDDAQDGCVEPPSTSLGALIEVHGGIIATIDWTDGCIAVTDVEVDQLWNAIGLRDTIVVLP